MTARPMVWTMVRTLALTVALLACKSGGSNAREGGARVTSPAIDALLAGVPGDALAVGFIDLETPPRALVTGGVMPLDEAARQTLDKELRRIVPRRELVRVPARARPRRVGRPRQLPVRRR